MKKMKRFMCLVAFLVALATGTAYGFEQAQEDPGPPPSKEQMEKLRERIETIRMWKLTEALDLDEQTAAKLFPVLNRYDKKRGEIEHQIREGMNDLRDGLRTGDEGKLARVIEGLEKKHGKLQSVKDEEHAEMKKVLSVQQQAKLILFQQRFEREIRKMIAEVRQRRGDGPEGIPGRRSLPGGPR